MPVSPRNRIVVFRLSEEEYRSLEEACDLRGARTVSEFTRSAILAALRVEPPDDMLPGIERVQQEITELRTAITELKRALEGKK